MKLTKDNMKGLTSRTSKTITVGEYEIRIIEMTIPQQLEIERIIQAKKSNSELLLPVLKFSVVDENDNPILDDDTINSLSANTAATIFQECIALNSISDKELEARAKN